MINLFDLIDSFLEQENTKYLLLLVFLFPALEIIDYKPKKRVKTMSFEKKIGEEFTWRGHCLKVVESEGCKDCFFFNMEDCYDVIFATGPCIKRKDEKTVKFVEIKKEDKDGE